MNSKGSLDETLHYVATAIKSPLLLFTPFPSMSALVFAPEEIHSDSILALVFNSSGVSACNVDIRRDEDRMY